VLACTAVPEAVRAFQDIRPRVVVRVRDVAVDRLVDSVAAGDVDIAVGPDRVTGGDVISQSLFDSAWVLWCSPRHPLARRKRLQWSDLLSEPLVAAGYDHERSVAQMRLSVPEESRVVPVDVVDNISTAMGVAAQGRVATLAPSYVGVLAVKFGLVMRRVVDPETVRKVCLYKPTGRSLSPAAEGFAEHLARWLPEWATRGS
jgi:DNA-binding transcriptional LysR family regulator